MVRFVCLDRVRDRRASRPRTGAPRSVRAAIAELPGSKIREVANAALGRSDVLPFWFGESDEPTPAFIRDTAIHSLNDGETFYAHNLGLPELCEALSGYVSGLHGPVGPETVRRAFLTSLSWATASSLRTASRRAS